MSAYNFVSFHGDKNIKQFYLDQIREHRQLGQITHDVYFWDGENGDAVGCTIHSHEYELYETRLGIPKWIAQIEDMVFDNLGAPMDQAWPYDFIRAIPVGVSWDNMWNEYCLMLINVLRYFLEKKLHSVYFLDAAALLHKRSVSEEKPTNYEWLDLQSYLWNKEKELKEEQTDVVNFLDSVLSPIPTIMVVVEFTDVLKDVFTWKLYQPDDDDDQFCNWLAWDNVSGLLMAAFARLDHPYLIGD